MLDALKLRVITLKIMATTVVKSQYCIISLEIHSEIFLKIDLMLLMIMRKKSCLKFTEIENTVIEMLKEVSTMNKLIVL